mmetsp:Transcript_12205/g.28261  ORF Transcript_12205/g.28261 Transcript_12205/m.28261 type:complete len:259 (+) Transcript_12205:419-1195(+)
MRPHVEFGDACILGANLAAEEDTQMRVLKEAPIAQKVTEQDCRGMLWQKEAEDGCTAADAYVHGRFGEGHHLVPKRHAGQRLRCAADACPTVSRANLPCEFCHIVDTPLHALTDEHDSEMAGLLHRINALHAQQMRAVSTDQRRAAYVAASSNLVHTRLVGVLSVLVLVLTVVGERTDPCIQPPEASQLLEGACVRVWLLAEHAERMDGKQRHELRVDAPAVAQFCLYVGIHSTFARSTRSVFAGCGFCFPRIPRKRV